MQTPNVISKQLYTVDRANCAWNLC